MEITRETVLQWLADNHRGQNWLAKQCGVSDQAVSNWLREKNSRPISATAAIKIQELMEEDAAKIQAKPPHNLVLEFTDDEYTPVEKAALDQKMPIREWAKRILNEAASMTDAEFFAAFIDKKLIPLPAKAHIQAAAGLPTPSDVQEWEGADDTVRVKANGLSMSPLIDDGEVITMHHRRAAKSPFMKKGLIYLVAYDGGHTIKEYNTRLATPEEIEEGISYVSTSDGKTKVRVLRSKNPDYPDIVIRDEVKWDAWIEPEELEK